MSININITFIHISRLILASKSTSFTFFHMNIRLLITFFRRRFVYIHTFFHHKIMCGCILAIRLYDIMHTSYEHRLYHNHVAPSTTISATFTSTIDKIYLQVIRAVTLVLRCPVCLHNAAAFMYKNILLGENLYSLIRAHMRKSGSIFSRRSIICTVYCWEKCKKL